MESYFCPVGGQSEDANDDDEGEGDNDPSKPTKDGFLDVCDRERREDISWSTSSSPMFGNSKKRKSPAGKGGIDVWAHIGRLDERLHFKYSRPHSNLIGYTHACFHCGKTLSLGWSKKSPQGVRLSHGCWQTTVAHRHLRSCPSLPKIALKKLENQDKELKKMKTEKGILRNVKVAMPLKLQCGEVVFSERMEADTREAVKVAIARTVIYSQTQLPDHYLDCPFEKDKQRLLYKAGFMDAVAGKTNSGDFPTLGSRAVAAYVDSEDAIQRAYGRLWGQKLDVAASGNPHSQVQSDLVTLADRGKWQSIGHTDLCPVTSIPFTVASGFRHVDDKTNETCAADMEDQAQLFFGRKQLSVAHSIVTDVGAFGVGQEVVREYPFGTELHRDKCMMHQMSKVVGFGAGSYGYKDGSGGKLHRCIELEQFNNDFRSMEVCFRRADNADLLAKTAVRLGTANLRCRSQFNVTRCAGEMHQHTWALRMSKAIRTIQLEHPSEAQHDFTGGRWKELQEIHALEQLSGGLTMKCQTEQVATAGYWYHWLDTTFGVLAGRLPLSVVDMDNVGASPKLPMVLRNPDSFQPLPSVVRQRHQTEFKRRFGLTGDISGMDVDVDWRPTMTPAFGLPILLDPRLNNVTSKFGLTEHKRQEYEVQLHDLHYCWYKRARFAKIAKNRISHERMLEATAILEDALAKSKKQDPEEAEADDDMGWDNPVAKTVLVSKPVPPPTPAHIPLVAKSDFLACSHEQYKAYLNACRTDIRWRTLYPDDKYCVGHKGVVWQEKLAHVNLAPVWNALAKLNKNGLFGFFTELAKHSRANVYKLQASSFVERVNSAGKIVLNDTNIKLMPDKVEKRVMLRMNRKWMSHMMATYPDVNADIMALLRKSHEALQVQPSIQGPIAPLVMSMELEDVPHWPPNIALDEDHARLIADCD